MACCDSSPNVAYWSLFSHRDDGKRKLSVRPVFPRWKRPGKRREILDTDGLLDGRQSVAETARSVSRSTCYAESSQEAAYSVNSSYPVSISKKISQPVLRAIRSIRHIELLHSTSDMDLRSSSSLSNRFNRGNSRGYKYDHEYEDKYESKYENRYENGTARGSPTMVDVGQSYPNSRHPQHQSMVTTHPKPTRAFGQCQTSRLLTLPQEIRDEIYAYVFYSTRLTMGRRVTCAPPTDSPCSGSASSSRTLSPEPDEADEVQHSQCRMTPGRVTTHVKPARHSMALFLVCRQITRELISDNAWIGQVLFNFEDAATMLDVLGGVFATPAQRSLVREVRVREGGLFVHQRLPSLLPLPTVPEDNSTPLSSASSSTQQQQQQQQPQQQFRQRFLLLGGLMRLLPGLCLDRLTVLPALPCRVHKSTRCHNLPSVNMYNMSVTSHPPPPVSLAAPHEMLTELLHAGSGWKELCYVHHDTNMLAADKHRPSSVEAMMVNMGFWDADMDTYDDVFAAAERAERLAQAERADLEEAEAARLLFLEEDEELQEGEGTLFMPQHRRHRRLGSLFASYSARKEYRLPRWRHLLTERDGLIPANNNNNDTTRDAVNSSVAAGWSVSIDAVIDEGFYEGDTPRSTISVYGVRGGQALWPMETLEDVHDSRIRGEDFMVIVRRGDGEESGEAGGPKTVQKKKADPSKAVWAESVGNPYPFKEGDPRALGYGTRWETLRPVLFPWDHLAATRIRHDRYRHRDEYVVRSQRRRS
ncbi:uncharacterized protein SPSK_00712 [Sporothrix schenckii 1099-18]|uniref:Uncharacterized protein n=1 Tax=Sporothrix schenckii 1099-18 TaxID=1397361 RepID=A0A0F2M138_SPOSC|nr:uncharacterized protein SPSK_00712 [Sporothrix schenckii 1099-18]KJR81871.1 hypothetical protein SPSK_00712 [Sporothrix schenckii 1099-18]